MSINQTFNEAVSIYNSIVDQRDLKGRAAIEAYHILRKEVVRAFTEQLALPRAAARNLFQLVDTYQQELKEGDEDITDVMIPGEMSDDDVRRSSLRQMEKAKAFRGATLIIRHDC